LMLPFHVCLMSDSWCLAARCTCSVKIFSKAQGRWVKQIYNFSSNLCLIVTDQMCNDISFLLPTLQMRNLSTTFHHGSWCRKNSSGRKVDCLCWILFVIDDCFLSSESKCNRKITP
jgi:hypothetical protein